MIPNEIFILKSRLYWNRRISINKNHTNEYILSHQFFNMRVKLFLGSVAMIITTSLSMAQDLAINTNQSDFFNDLSFEETVITDNIENKNDFDYEITEQVSKFDWRTKSFFISNGATKYSKAEILEVQSNKTVKEVDLNDSNRKVDMSNISAGSYYLILTNDSGEIHSEQIVIL